MKDKERSRSVMERAGMTFEGYHREAMLVKGNYITYGVCSILASEWTEHKKKRNADKPS